MECPNKSVNLKACNCTYPCGKKGNCCTCVKYHRSLGQLPACYFPDDAEKTYDRSIAYFISLYQQGRIR
ncbi:MAG: hypothetical protein JXB60_00950 [Candidatus Cloacimonetes bacterium]|nr:hypothetical protein [Candidatus Cloacimonadota bacterium]